MKNPYVQYEGMAFGGFLVKDFRPPPLDLVLSASFYVATTDGPLSGPQRSQLKLRARLNLKKLLLTEDELKAFQSDNEKLFKKFERLERSQFFTEFLNWVKPLSLVQRRSLVSVTTYVFGPHLSAAHRKALQELSKVLELEDSFVKFLLQGLEEEKAPSKSFWSRLSANSDKTRP